MDKKLSELTLGELLALMTTFVRAMGCNGNVTLSQILNEFDRNLQAMGRRYDADGNKQNP